jgi:molybdate-binding protein
MALAVLKQHAASTARLHLDLRVAGSVDCLRALNAGHCVVTSFPVPAVREASSSYAQAMKSHVKPGLHKVIGFCRRQQGLMLRPEHARSVHTLADIAQQQLRFVPLASEDCFLACLKPSLVTPAVHRLCEVLGSNAWKQMMGALPGYALGPAPGRVLTMSAALTRWRYRSSAVKMGTGRTTSIMSSGVGSEGLNVLRAADCGGRMGRMDRAHGATIRRRKTCKRPSSLGAG